MDESDSGEITFARFQQPFPMQHLSLSHDVRQQHLEVTRRYFIRIGAAGFAAMGCPFQLRAGNALGELLNVLLLSVDVIVAVLLWGREVVGWLWGGRRRSSLLELELVVRGLSLPHSDWIL